MDTHREREGGREKGGKEPTGGLGLGSRTRDQNDPSDKQADDPEARFRGWKVKKKGILSKEERKKEGKG